MWWIILGVVLAAAWLALSPRLNPRLYNRCMFKPDEERGDRKEFDLMRAAGKSSEMWFKNRSGKRLHAFTLGDLDEAPVLLLYNMGKDGDIYRRRRMLQLLRETGAAVFIYEYSGYGESEGTPSLCQLPDDAVDAFDIACSLGFEPHQIVLYGESLGSAIAAHIMKERRPGGLIIKSGFASLVRIARELVWPLRLYPSFMFPHPRLDTCANLVNTDVPVHVIHGERDRLARPHHARLMADVCGGESSLTWLPDSRHAFMPPEDEVTFTAAVRDFIMSLPGAKTPKSQLAGVAAE